MTELEILSRFVASGMTPTAAEAMWGNIAEESGGEANRVQGDFSPARSASKTYTQDVDEGRISPYSFAHDSRGYGLVQWTYWSRKQGLLSYARSRGVSIGDAGMQADYIVAELKRDYPALWQYLTTATDLYEATRKICLQYERPAGSCQNQAKAKLFCVFQALKTQEQRSPSDKHRWRISLSSLRSCETDGNGL